MTTSTRAIGAHAPAGGGLAKASLRYAAAVRAEAIQVFAANPRAWAPPAGGDEQRAELRARVDATGLPVFVHAPYLINLGSPDEAVRIRSASLLEFCLRRGASISARGVVVHAGSSITPDREAGLRRMRESMLPLLDDLGAAGPDVLIEPMAGQGQTLCSAVGEIGPYLAALDWHPRAMLCLDTCHLLGAGHDLTADGGMAGLLAELERVAAGRLRLVHANDAKDPCGSKRDRHENIGGGMIGARPFWELLHDPRTSGVAFIVETPGGEAGQAKDIARLKRLRTAARAPGTAGARASRTAFPNGA